MNRFSVTLEVCDIAGKQAQDAAEEGNRGKYKHGKDPRFNQSQFIYYHGNVKPEMVFTKMRAFYPVAQPPHPSACSGDTPL